MHEVRFASDVELAGTLRLPAGARGGGAVALVHGSGPQTRDGRGTDFDNLRVGTIASAFLALMDNWIRRWLAARRVTARHGL